MWIPIYACLISYGGPQTTAEAQQCSLYLSMANQLQWPTLKRGFLKPGAWILLGISNAVMKSPGGMLRRLEIPTNLVMLENGSQYLDTFKVGLEKNMVFRQSKA